MGKKALYVVFIWIAVGVSIVVLYLLREVSPVKEFIDWAVSVWPLLATLGGIGIFISGWVIKHDFSKKAKLISDGLGIQPKSYDNRDVVIGKEEPIENEPEISIDIDKCSVSHYGQSDQAIEVALTLRVKSPPVNITDVQLYMGDEKLKLLSPTMPITQKGNKECHTVKYKLSLTTIYEVDKDKRDKYRIFAVAMGQNFPSKVFSINKP